MRAFLLCCGAVVVALLVCRIGAEVIEQEEVPPPVALASPGSAPALAPPRLQRIGGLVQDDRDGIGDVVITLSSLDQPRRPEMVVVTDSRGWWTAEVAPGRYRLGAFARDYLPQLTDVVLPSAEELVTRLVRGGTAVHGAVLDATGRPLRDAKVVIHDGELVAGVALTEGDGRFRATIARSYTKVSAHAADHVDDEIERGPADIVLRLVPGVSLQGVVTRGDEVCPEAEVVLEVSYDGSYTRELQARTDDYGQFSLVAPRGDAKLTATGPGCAATIPLQLHLTGPRSVHLVADAGHQISGRVVVRNTAVRGATVTLADGVRRSLEVRTDDDGAFIFQGVPASSIELSVTHREHLLATTRSVEVIADRDLTIELDPGRVIRGRIEPAAVTMLRVDRAVELTSDDLIGAPPPEGTSAADGTFTLYGAPDVDVVVTATADGRRGKVTLTAGTDRDHVRIALVAEGTATLSGRVVDDRGAPIEGEEVLLSQLALESRRTTTDAAGWFRIDRLAASRVQLSVNYRDSIEVELADNATANVTVVVPRKTSVIRGRVVEDGLPVAGVWVSAAPVSGVFALPIQAMTREDGSFELTGLPAVAQKLSLSRDTELIGETTAEPGGMATIIATRRHTLTVHAMHDGKPVREFTLSCSSRDGGGFWTMVRSADGRHRTHLRVVGPITCLAEVGELGAVAIGSGHELELAFEPLTLVTAQVSPGMHALYRFGAEPQDRDATFLHALPEIDEAGHVEVRIYPGAGTVTLSDEQYRARGTWPVTGTRGGRIDLGTLIP